MKKVVVVGGGLAGLAAAVRLAEADVPVLLLESRGVLGGRAGSFVDAASHEVVDNCQHVGLGCCVEWLEFCRAVGAFELLASFDKFYYREPSGRESVLKPSWLPAPFHLSPAFLGLKFLSWIDKLRLGLAIMRMVRQRSDLRPFQDWLHDRKQSEQLISRFWQPILTSALNESLDRIEYRYARQVVVEGFLLDRRGARMYVPSAPLTEIYHRAADWLEQRNVQIERNQAVTSVEIDRTTNQATGCLIKNRLIEGSHFIMAVPPHRASMLFAEDLKSIEPAFATFDRFEYSPITSVHCWFDRPVMDRPHLTPLDRTVQWLFRRSEQTASTGVVEAGDYVQAVISASRELESLGKERIADKIVSEIRSILPAAADAKLVHYRVVTERRATISVTPGIDAWRPGQQTRFENVWLAGDYTATGWPATMEGAVRSGNLSAAGVLAALGSVNRRREPPQLGGRIIRWMLRVDSGSAVR